VSELGAPDGDEHGEQDDVGNRDHQRAAPERPGAKSGVYEEALDEVESSACLSSARRTATRTASRMMLKTQITRGQHRAGGEVWRLRGSLGRGGVVGLSELGAPDGDEHGEQDDVEQRQQQQPDDDAEDDVGAQQAATAATLVVH